jgi:GNAT superfamily N-acetyltransferase
VAHPLAVALDGVVRGDHPVPDGRIEVVGSPPDGPSALVSFTAHTFIALDVDVVEVARRLDPDDLGAPVAPPFVQWLATASGLTRVGTFDAVLAAFAVGGEPAQSLERVDRLVHPRVAQASRHRSDVRIYRTADRDGVVVLGRGLTRRWELAFEVDEDARARGVGTRMLAAARTLLPAGTPLWMQIAPGNARSMRAAISAGFHPMGAEILFT